MFLILIPAAWLSISLMIIAVCVMASRGDEAIAIARSAALPIRAHRGTVGRVEPGWSREFATARGGRARGARCASGS